MAKRIVRKVRYSTTPASRFQKFIGSFTPANFRNYWFSRAGLKRVGKIAAFGFGFLFLVALFFARDLPNPNKVRATAGAQTTRFYARDELTNPGKGTLLYEVFGDKNRSIIPFDKMPQNIKDATVAVEDKHFYKRALGAFSVAGILRAAIVDVMSRNKSQGGSTITQQYVKNALLTNERSFSRKIKELILSIEIASFYSKDDILKLYLNEIPYGSNAYGIQAGAKTYYKKDLSKGDTLTLDEAATLAAIPRAPTYYSPYGSHPDALQARRNLILTLMEEQGYATSEEVAEAKKIDAVAKIKQISPVPDLYANIKAPHFSLYVQELLEAKYTTKTVTEGGLKVITTLDMNKQNAAEAVVNPDSTMFKNVKSLGGSNAAIVASDPKTGQILAMKGSVDFANTEFGAFNVAIAERQPGSSFKPFVYATAFAGNYGPGSTIYDVTTDFGGGYKPQNFGNKTYGVQSMRSALGGSLNIPAVKALYLAGIEKSLDTAHKLGITTLKKPASEYGLSLTLGSGEVRLTDMVNGYESFANGGLHYAPTAILKVTDAKNNVLEEFKAKPATKALDPQIAYMISSILSDNPSRAFVFGNILSVPGHTVAVKTGTTEHFNDAWTVGYTPSLVAGVWAGNNNNAPMSQAAAAISVPIWREFMKQSLAGKPDEPFVRPAGIKEVTLDANTGKLASESTKVKRTDIFPSWYKPATAASSRSAKVDKLSGKLATECTPPLAIETAFANDIHAEIPPSDPAYGRWEPPVAALAASLGYTSGGALPTESDNIHHCDDIKPQVNLVASDMGGGRYKVKVTVTSGTFTANQLEIRLDDQIVSTQTINGSTTYEFDNTIESNGSHFYKATVIDAGLYSAEDTAPVTVTDAGGPSNGFDFRGTSPTGTHNGSTVLYSWTPYPGPGMTYQLYVDNSPIGTPSPAANKSVPNTTVNRPHTWYVQAIKGGSVVATTDSITYINLP